MEENILRDLESLFAQVEDPHCVTRNLSHGEDVGVLSLPLSLSFTPDARSHEGASENARSAHASCRRWYDLS